ncbi:secretion protein HlyD [Marivirga tractuosa]|uniref:Efflux transporter, RND family, MFP subunit n=1 Tax=Marivirga tractuosa (strain ATCC 23168 / DSM 4126 / NBRC 15989 / NCIMB 1408 / VKM B-1430 / H-43) TaxID=643867 RepID=E4TUK3_MARTH|nr:efflux RND transporter periplasmic adaptor subunit [Marivirga tractuosa]ADR23096.1 efflux transporter, RND family, MFP subunit [Marivirga tractuosa DSM 4126]BDD16230.1 secretion protein HlyD [Marivirga tractuosa]
MNKKLIIAGSAIILVIIAFFTFRGGGTTETIEIMTEAQSGDFVIAITTTGELEAKNSIKITGPSGLRAARLWNVKIDKLVDEGTVVKKGDFVASLDASELADRLRNVENEYQQSLSQYTQTKLDTALTLRQSRDELINLEFAVEEKKLVLEQSQFEPPATIKQAEIDLSKAERAFKQAKENYLLKKDKAVAQMQEAAAELSEDRDERDFLLELRQKFRIMAPEDGMVIYVREYDGSKKSEGASIGAWDPTVATLPDLSTMISTTFVNEVDIRKIAKGQHVNIGLDAFPDKKLTGEVIYVANVGEQRPNSDAKVFEVKVEINETDTTLRPAMSTANEIITDMIPKATYIPLESVFNQGDSISYVYKKSGLETIKQEVELGKANANEVIVNEGIDAGEKVYLIAPEGMEEKDVSLLKASKN